MLSLRDNQALVASLKKSLLLWILNQRPLSTKHRWLLDQALTQLNIIQRQWIFLSLSSRKVLYLRSNLASDVLTTISPQLWASSNKTQRSLVVLITAYFHNFWQTVDDDGSDWKMPKSAIWFLRRQPFKNAKIPSFWETRIYSRYWFSRRILPLFNPILKTFSSLTSCRLLSSARSDHWNVQLCEQVRETESSCQSHRGNRGVASDVYGWDVSNHSASDFGMYDTERFVGVPTLPLSGYACHPPDQVLWT